MLTVWLTEEKKGATAMLLGGFDGLHIGHRKLLERAKASGLPVGVMTIRGGKEGSIFTEREREYLFARAGVDFLCSMPFAKIKDKTPQEFLALLERKFTPKLYVCGEDFRFGAGAKGTPDDLKERGQGCVEVLPLLEIDGEKVSTRTIKARLKAGEVEKANEMLGEPFFLIGRVKEDRKIGRTLGFPTANISYPSEKFPLKMGVYETRVTVDGKRYKGITNFGARPTFDEEGVVTETYLDGFDGDLYGSLLAVEFVRFLRDIKKFDSADELKAQLRADIRRVKEND